MKQPILALATALVTCAAFAQVRPNAPPDQPQAIEDRQAAAFEAAIAPFVAEARKSYPEAKNRFLKGLPSGQVFFVTARLKDADGHWEQVFIRVSSIEGRAISGTIASDVQVVRGFQYGQSYTLR